MYNCRGSPGALRRRDGAQEGSTIIMIILLIIILIITMCMCMYIYIYIYIYMQCLIACCAILHYIIS